MGGERDALVGPPKSAPPPERITYPGVRVLGLLRPGAMVTITAERACFYGGVLHGREFEPERGPGGSLVVVLPPSSAAGVYTLNVDGTLMRFTVPDGWTEADLGGLVSGGDAGYTRLQEGASHGG